MHKPKPTQKTKNKRRNRNKKIAAKGIDTLADLLRSLHIADWDVLLIGDGSGSDWLREAGWSCLLVDATSGARKLFYGAMNFGSIAIAEAMPYFQAMLWYTGAHGPWRTNRKIHGSGRQYQVHIITDSITTTITGKNPQSRKANRELWAALDAFAAKGIHMHYHHVPRTVVAANILTDTVAYESRALLKNTDIVSRSFQRLRKDIPGLPEDLSIYDFNR